MASEHTANPKNENLESAHSEALDQIERYSLLVESVSDYAIFLLDTGGHIATWNAGAKRFKQYEPHEIIGKHFSIFYTPEDLESRKPDRELKEAIETGRTEDEYWRVRKDGTRFWANVVITSLRNKQGELIGFAKVTRDLTDRKLHEDALREANALLEHQRDELRRLNKNKDEFISLASHQLRTPATAVKQYIGLLLEGYAGELTDQQKSFLRRANQSNDRQIATVNDLLKVAQVDSGKVILHKQPTDFVALLQDIVDDHADTFTSRQQTATVNIEDGVPLVPADTPRIRMAIDNLIDNASKYTPPEGDITLSLRIFDGCLRLSVADSGVGIAKDDIPRLFDKFARVHNELSESVGGSGLGLYWANRVVKMHGGSIDVESQPGLGSIFSLNLPLQDD